MSLAVRLGIVLLLALHLAAPYLPEAGVWGVWHYSVLPPVPRWGLALVVAALTANPVADAALRAVRGLWHRLPGKNHRLAWRVFVSLAAMVPFWLLRIRHLRWGDADFIVKALAYTGADRPVWTIYNWQSPLTIFTHAKLWLLLNPGTGIAVDTLYALTSVLAGGIFVFLCLSCAGLLGDTTSEKFVLAGLLLTVGAVELFFGYIENYTLMSVGLLLTLYLSLRHIRSGTSLVWPSLSLAVTNAFHPSTIVVWPALLYLGTHPPVPEKPGRPATAVHRWLSVLLPPILVFVALSAFMAAGGHGPGAMLVDDRPGGADAIPFVPLFRVTTEWQHYTMFSAAHFLDWINEHLLISPAGLLLLGVFAVAAVGRSLGVQRSAAYQTMDGRSSRETTFLAVAGLTYLLLTFVWNPDYGGRKDWDLFAPSAFVYTLWAAVLFVRRWRTDKELARLGLLLISFSAVHTGTWVIFNTLL